MRYAIISDIHANYDALQAVDQVVRKLRSREGGQLKYWFLGDIVGYGPEPIECLRWLRYTSKVGQRWVPGNHDVEVLRLASSSAAAAQGASERANISWRLHLQQLRRPENSGWWQWFKQEINQAINNEQRSLVVEKHGDLACVFVHGSINAAVRRTQYLYPWAQYKRIMQIDLQRLWEMHGKEQRTVCLFHGHTHYPIVAHLKPNRAGVSYRSIPYGQPIPLGDGCIAINPGSVGQPRDGDPRASFAILDTKQRTITFHRVMYNINHTINKLEAGGYPQSVINLVSTANGGANLSYYRTIYRAPELHHLPTVGEE